MLDLTIVLDRSGSMRSCKTDMEGALQEYLRTIAPIPSLVTLYTFASSVRKEFEAIPISDVPTIEITPQGFTSMLDAIGMAVNQVGARLSAMEEAQRPDKVIFAIITDGEENHSKVFTYPQIRAMIEHQQEKYSWEFLFFGANIDAESVGKSIGVQSGNSISYTANTIGTRAVMDSLISYTVQSTSFRQ